jgi:hypothetical protein
MRPVGSTSTSNSLPSDLVARLRDRLGGQDGLLVALAILVGIGAGVGAIGFPT